jgi:hypothetical protein
VKNYTPGGGQWQVKKRGMKPNVMDVVASHGIAEAHRLGLLQ